MAKSKSVLGIDIAGGGIKVVEFINENGRARFRTFGFTENEDSANALANVEASKLTLEKIFKEAHIKGGGIINAALPTQSVFSSIFTLPKMGKDEREKAIELQIQKMIATPIAELEVASRELGGMDSFDRIFFTAASKKVVATYHDFFKTCKLTLNNLEIESLAIIRALIGKDQGNNVLIDFGKTRTNIVLVEKGIPVMSRSIKTGSEDATKKLATSLGVAIEQAETMKQNLKTFPPILNDFINTITTEVRYLINEWNAQNKQPRVIDKVILTGGGARMACMVQVLSDALKLRIYLGDPWARVRYSQELRPLLDQMGPRLTVAVGLALRSIEEE